MSDVSITIDGLLAFVVSAALGCLLLLAAGVCLIFAWLESRGTLTRFISQSTFAHAAGMLVSVGGFAAVVLMMFVQDDHGWPQGQWLDRWAVVWTPAVLLAWPLSVYAAHRGRRNIRRV